MGSVFRSVKTQDRGDMMARTVNRKWQSHLN